MSFFYGSVAFGQLTTIFAPDFTGTYVGSGDNQFDSEATAEGGAYANISVVGSSWQMVSNHNPALNDPLNISQGDNHSATRLTRSKDADALPFIDNTAVISLDYRWNDNVWASGENNSILTVQIGENFRTGAFNPSGGGGNGPSFASMSLQARSTEGEFRFTAGGGPGSSNFNVLKDGDGFYNFSLYLAFNNHTESQLFDTPFGLHDLGAGMASVWANGTNIWDNYDHSNLDKTASFENVSFGMGNGTNRTFDDAEKYGGTFQVSNVAVQTIQFITWDDEGVNTNFSTDENWSNMDVGLPGTDPLGGTSTKIAFANAGNTATVDVNTQVSFLKFEANANAFTIGGSGTITMSGDNPAIIMNASANDQVIAASLAISAPSNALTFKGDSGVARTLTLSGVVSGTQEIVKEGDYTLVLSNPANTFSGDVRVKAGTFAIGADDVLDSGSDLILSGGTFATQGHDQTFTNLTLTANSIIDMGNANSTLTFTGTVDGLLDGSSNPQYTLSIWNWTGDPLDPSNNTDRLIFSGMSFPAAALGQFLFYSDGGTTLYGSKVGQLTGGEVAPVPEPSAYITLLGLLTVILYRTKKVKALCRLVFKR